MDTYLGTLPSPQTSLGQNAFASTTSTATSNIKVSQSSKNVSKSLCATPTPEQSALTPASSGFHTPTTPKACSVRTLSLPTNSELAASSEDLGDRNHTQTYAFSNTRQMMYQKTESMFVIASRGFERDGHVPTMQTTPKLLNRRYTIDVTTKNLGQRFSIGWFLDSRSPAALNPINTRSKELEPPLQPEPPLPLSDVRRYHIFASYRAGKPALNDDIYLELGTATIRNDAFHYIRAIDLSLDGKEVWMRGETLDMAFEVLHADKRFEEYSIDFANCNTAQVFYFACRRNDAHERTYDDYRARFQNKNWIFIICNDGFGAASNEDTNGTHWSLLAMDRVHKIAHYYDSLYIYYSEQQHLAFSISLGLLRILGEYEPSWTFRVESNSPNQYQHNQYRGDGGPCGPFVWKMTDLLSNKIQSHVEEGIEQDCFLHLNDGFPHFFENIFHSYNERVRIQQGIMRWKSIKDSSRALKEHDQAAIRGAHVELLQTPNPWNLSEVPNPRFESEGETELMSDDLDSDCDTTMSNVSSPLGNDEM